ncbi:hypothetical protein [Larkinella sp. C7]|uniref:hypothetical protein n=1 Tax=Larkinella sp. C7 TaxID=2576607 RepID=UPI0011110581|nr:hypothetical protein [Larkinella sp. C7]
MQEIFNQSVELDRFSFRGPFQHVFSQPSHARYLNDLRAAFTQRELEDILRSLLRFAFYIEPVKPDVKSTKFTVRWSERMQDDPRYCSYDNCLIVFDQLLGELEAACNDAERVEILKLVIAHGLIPYEINVDYHQRLTQQIHRADNISFFWDETVKQTYLLRRYLLNPANHGYITFFRETYSKIATKAFLTDRAQTGVNKTNREKRWECHPESVHFAIRRECLAIEFKLVTQICHFRDFPAELRQLLAENTSVIFSDDFTRCPITLEPILFENFNNEILNPMHGRSSMQVGHIHPLKAVGVHVHAGHTADNISWITSVGNRIQGDLSVDETRRMIYHIIENYRQAGLIN